MQKIILIIGFLIITFSSFGQNFQQNEGITFSVSPVEKAKSNLPEIDYKTAIEIRTNKIIESYPMTEKNRTLVATDAHAFISALHIAFAQHRPIVISPDMIWLMIIQGVGMHIHENKDTLQNVIVNFDNKKQIIIRKDEFIKGNENNDWESVFSQFSDSIQEYMDDSLYSLFTPSFSTTSIKEKNAFEVALMSAVDSYFDYTVVTFCGISEITLEGTTDDWKWIAENCKKLNKIGLSNWTMNLQPILNEFVNASQGKIDTIFWQSMYKWCAISGGPLITGWIIKFFPYIYKDNTIIQNPYIQGDRFAYIGLKSNNFPSGLSKTDLKWLVFENGLWNKYDMELYSGFIGVYQDTSSKSLRPEICWAIRDKNEKVYSNSEQFVSSDTIQVNDTIVEIVEYFQDTEESENLLDTLRIDYDETDVWLHQIREFDIDYYLDKGSNSEKYKKPNLFPTKCANYEESIVYLETYISECLQKRINFKGKISFNVTWFGKIDNVNIIESNKPEYNEQITTIVNEISGCEPGIFRGKLANIEIMIELKIK